MMGPTKHYKLGATGNLNKDGEIISGALGEEERLLREGGIRYGPRTINKPLRGINERERHSAWRRQCGHKHRKWRGNHIL